MQHLKLGRFSQRLALFGLPHIVLTLSVWGAIETGRPAAAQDLPVGFEYADADQDGRVTQLELTDYLKARLPDQPLPFALVFNSLDTDGDQALSSDEFDRRHEVLDQVMQDAFAPPVDPGKDFVPFKGAAFPIDDVKIFGAVFHRYYELLTDEQGWQEAGWSPLDFASLPASVPMTMPTVEDANAAPPTLDQMGQSTAIIIGGGASEQFFTAGAVILNSSGLAVTNFHVIESFNDKIIALLADGRAVRVTKVLAGNRAADVALIQLQGENFIPVSCAAQPPVMADDLVLLHHTEMRYYTFDRGYVKRHIVASDTPWMEISGNYGPGGSGCGIFNSKHQLVGLVSLIMMGDGPDIASSPLIAPLATAEGQEREAGELEYDAGESEYGDDWADPDSPYDPSVQVIRLAVPWTAIRSLFAAP